MGLATREAELAKIVASGGLAPARCPGLIASLRSLRLAAPGAGHGKHTPAAARRSFAAASETLRAASETLRAAQGRLLTCNGKQVRSRRSRTGARITDVEDAQKLILRLARQMSDAGEIVLAGRGDDFV